MSRLYIIVFVLFITLNAQSQQIEGTYFPSSFNDGLNNLGDVSNNLQLLKSYPNPFSHTINLELKAPVHTQISVSVLNFSGKVIFSTTPQLFQGLNKLVLNFEALAQGLYILSIQDGDYQIRQTISKY